ncbi:chaplin [Actinorugispora endophytica]|uniref:Small secreted domain DUF320 n=1 Tax=Actinorugispora endophytica TaxID=1605990 RepID=A0A4R6V948_9ACTN|nr:chaplin [Actinorugispora endophytica]TDQ55328.1 small secreted domain DUF320 [Actinorugispora endophytica]
MRKKKMLATASTAALTVGLVGAFSPFSPFAFADQITDGSGGVAGGNQVNVPVDVEAGLCGNALAALGLSKAECTEVSRVLYAASDEGQAAGGQASDGSGGVASGNQVNIPVDAAVDVCGNSVAVGGLSKAECTEVVHEIAGSSENEQASDGSGGVASGNQINIPVNIAVEVCGNSIGVLGVSKAECETVVDAISASSDNEGGGGQASDGSGGVASGNQVNIPVDAAVDVCGNAVTVLSLAETECMEEITDGGEPGDGEGPEQPGEPGDSDGEEPGDDSEGPEQPGEPGDSDGEEPGDDSEGPGDDRGGEEAEADERPAADGSLPVTGVALGGLVAAAVAALGGGGAAMYLSRRKKAAAAASQE